MMHKTCSINYGHLADLQKTLPTTDLNKKNFHLIKYLLGTFIFFLSYQSVLVDFGKREALNLDDQMRHQTHLIGGHRVTLICQLIIILPLMMIWSTHTRMNKCDTGLTQGGGFGAPLSPHGLSLVKNSPRLQQVYRKLWQVALLLMKTLMAT